jgi:hypothetical protein
VADLIVEAAVRRLSSAAQGMDVQQVIGHALADTVVELLAGDERIVYENAKYELRAVRDARHAAKYVPLRGAAQRFQSAPQTYPRSVKIGRPSLTRMIEIVVFSLPPLPSASRPFREALST